MSRWDRTVLRNPTLDLVAAPVLRLDEVDSTNTHARSLANEAATSLPLVITAGKQTAGRGRGTNRWFSDSGSLTLTALLDPEALGLRSDHWPRLALAAAVAVADAIEPYLSREPAGIRWPNDVEVGGRKVAGLLPERFETPFGPRLALGIGLNVLTEFETAPEPVKALATSLRLEAAPGRPAPDLASMQTLLLWHLSERLVALALDDPALCERWQSLDTLRGRSVTIEQGSSVLSGTGGGIREDGALVLLGDSGPMPVFGGVVRRGAG